ncbi:hypothetical protein BJX68DRAFT_271230 [Aspergillus pseudodeflectus]|uniref:Uncharacterized protein n=1 Tax=Aspergillus pseudodeflectus TaxID=176178 RepID=A0ABR4JMU1_9EURO
MLRKIAMVEEEPDDPRLPLAYWAFPFQQQPHDWLAASINCMVQECSVLDIARRNVEPFINEVFNSIRGLNLHGDRQWHPPGAVHGVHAVWEPSSEQSNRQFLPTVHCKVQRRLARHIPRAAGIGSGHVRDEHTDNIVVSIPPAIMSVVLPSLSVSRIAADMSWPSSRSWPSLEPRDPNKYPRRHSTEPS